MTRPHPGGSSYRDRVARLFDEGIPYGPSWNTEFRERLREYGFKLVSVAGSDIILGPYAPVQAPSQWGEADGWPDSYIVDNKDSRMTPRKAVFDTLTGVLFSGMAAVGLLSDSTAQHFTGGVLLFCAVITVVRLNKELNR